MSKKILGLGGGTAGWLTALYCTKTFPQHEITVMESKSIGIVGVGEGSTPPLVDFLKLLGVDIDDLLKKQKVQLNKVYLLKIGMGMVKSIFIHLRPAAILRTLLLLQNFHTIILLIEKTYITHYILIQIY